MSGMELSTSGQLSAMAAAGVDLPDRPDTVIEESEGKGKCTVFYKYLADKGDQCSCRLEDSNVSSPSDGFHIVFSVKRHGSDKVAVQHRTKCIPFDLKDRLVIKSESLEVKKNMYVVKIKKTSSLNLTGFYRPDSPSA